MRLKLALQTACAAVSIMISAGPAAAQDAEPAPQPSAMRVELGVDTIVVTGTPVAQDAFVTPADIDVLSGAGLEERRSAGLGQTLDALPGVNVVATGQQVGNPVVRGLTGNRIRVLSDGIGLNYQQYGVRHPANLDPYLADRIEIVRGPASLQFGSDAIGGAINVIPERSPFMDAGESVLKGELTAGYSTAYEASEGAFTLAGANGGLGFIGTVVARNSEGMTTPDEPTAFESGDNTDPLVTGDLPYTDYEHLNGDIAFGFLTERAEGLLRWEAYRSEQNYLLPDPGAPVQPGGIGQELKNDIVQARLDVRLNDLFTMTPQLAYVRNVRRANPGGAAPVPLPVPDGVADTDIVRESVTGRLVVEHGALLGLEGQIGGELTFEEQESRGPTRLTPGGVVQNAALFMFEQAEFGRLILNAGARFDHRSQKADPERTANDAGLPAAQDLAKRDYDAATGGVGFSYRLTSNLVATGNWRTAFRAPELFELYAYGQHNGVAAVQLGDPDLVEEKARTLDGSLRWKSMRVEASLTAYRTAFDDYITLAGTGASHPTSGLPIFQYVQGDAELVGGDLDVLIRPAEGWEIGAVYELVRGEFEASGDDLPLLPADTIQGRVRRTIVALGPLRDVYLEARARHAADRAASGPLEPFYQFDQPGSAFGVASTQAYTLIGFSAGAELGDLTARLDVSNITNEAYRDFLDTYKSIALGAGRDFRFTLTYRF